MRGRQATPELARLIRVRMAELDIRQAELAGRIGRSQGWVSRLTRRPARVRVYLEDLHRLADALELPVGELVQAAGWQSPQSDPVRELAELLARLGYPAPVAELLAARLAGQAAAREPVAAVG